VLEFIGPVIFWVIGWGNNENYTNNNNTVNCPIYSDVLIRVRNCGRRSVLREKRSSKPHTVVPIRSVQRTGNQRIAVHHGRSVPHQHEVRPRILRYTLIHMVKTGANHKT